MLYHYYRLVNNVDDQCYIGMTTRELRKRLYEHRHQCMKCSSNELMERYGKKNISIILIHSLEFSTREEARREERRLIEEYAEQSVNMVRRPYQSKDERKTQNREYYDTHIEDRRKYNRVYYEAHNESILTKKIVYREAHRERARAYAKAYREAKKATPPPDASSDTQQTQP